MADDEKHELLGKRLLEYLGLQYREVSQPYRIYVRLAVSGVYNKSDRYLTDFAYPSWQSVLFGDAARDSVSHWINLNRGSSFKAETVRPAFDYLSPEELELQLSVRGF